MSSRCRSTISAVISEGTRTAKVKGKNIRVPADMKYSDYKAVYIDKSVTLKDWQERLAKAAIEDKRGQENIGRLANTENVKTATENGRTHLPVTYSFGQKSNSSTKIYSGVECTVSYSKEKFYNGQFERDCIVYTTKEGVKFFFPKDLDVNIQMMTPEIAVRVWNEVPKLLRDISQKKIVFLDVYNPDDDYWRRVYENFTTSYATSGREIIFWRHDSPHSPYYLKHTYCHEIGHFIDGDAGDYSSSSAWLAAMEADEKTSGARYVTSYGKNSPSEDFADSVAEYFVNHKSFIAKFPERAKLLKEVFENG